MTLQAHLDLLKKAAELKNLSLTVQPIHHTVVELNTWIVRSGADAPEPEELVLDGDDQELDEALLGVGFVACQVGMAHVASRACRLAKFCKDNGIATLTGWVNKDEIYKLGDQLQPGGPSKIVFLNAVANYFKHRDEWADTNWASLKGSAAKTAATISHGGLSHGAKDNIRKATTLLDDGIFDAVKEWAGSVVAEAEHDLAAHL